MPLQTIYAAAKPQMEAVIDKLKSSLSNLHTGRASTALVEDIMVSHYGASMALKQVASIATPDATIITITPWDKTALGPIETALRDSGRNLNPTSDGTTIRIGLPPMSQERREEMVKLVHNMAEESRIGLRNIRKEAWEQVQNEVKRSALTEDDKYGGERDLNKMIDDYNAKVELLITTKEKELRTI